MTSDSPNINNDSRLRFLCSFGGRILPRPHDNTLRYVGGDTRIAAVNRPATFSTLLDKLSKFSGTNNVTLKYQLPNEDLDALITLTNDEDVDNMMEEYDRLSLNDHCNIKKTARLRLFLFSNDPVSRTSSIGSAKRDHWFFDALNSGSGSGLDRGRSNVSSIVSEFPDYLFELDPVDDPPRDDSVTKAKVRPIFNENVSDAGLNSDTLVVSSTIGSISSGLGLSYGDSNTDLQPVKVKADYPVSSVKPNPCSVEHVMDTGEFIVMQPGLGGNPIWSYSQGSHYPASTMQTMPVYYISGSGPLPGNVAVQQVPIPAQYVHQFSGPPGQVSLGIHQQVPGMGQMYAREVGLPVQELDPYDTRIAVTGGANQPVYYEVRNPGGLPMYPVVPGGEEIHGAVNESGGQAT